MAKNDNPRVKIRLTAESTAAAYGKKVGNQVSVDPDVAKALVDKGRAEYIEEKEEKTAAKKTTKEDKAADERKTKEA
ncbi:hypothetical protein [Larkinella soli]|uniref:hypothetical protein n=1 Tax=Larkinella soli TaxID=1770527 RepID=UPI000FFC9898|nr:hypothetical protein [Larkinella soli]